MAIISYELIVPTIVI